MVWGRFRGFHPRLLNLLPSGEHGFARSGPSTLQSGTVGFETASSPSGPPNHQITDEGTPRMSAAGHWHSRQFTPLAACRLISYSCTTEYWVRA